MEQIPQGKVRIKKLHPQLGDMTEIVDIKEAIIKIEDTELIIDEDTNQIVERSTLEGKLKNGEIKKIRTMPVISGGC